MFVEIVREFGLALRNFRNISKALTLSFSGTAKAKPYAGRVNVIRKNEGKTREIQMRQTIAQHPSPYMEWVMKVKPLVELRAPLGCQRRNTYISAEKLVFPPTSFTQIEHKRKWRKFQALSAIPHNQRINMVHLNSRIIKRNMSSYLECSMTKHGSDVCLETKYNVGANKDLEQGEYTNIYIKSPFKLYDLKVGPDVCVTVTKEQARSYYAQMRTVRAIDTAATVLQDKLSLKCDDYIKSRGQEACAVGIREAMGIWDNVITPKRCPTWGYLMGLSPYKVLANLTSNKAQYTHTDKTVEKYVFAPRHFSGGVPTGSQITLGTGVALTCKYNNEKGCALTLYNDDLGHQSPIVEGLSMASLLNLPCVFICENRHNGYCLNRKSSELSSTEYYNSGDYIPGIWVDGTDILAVFSAIKYAKEYSLKHGPLIVELNTCPQYKNYDDAHENCDPLKVFQKTCVESELLEEDEIQEINKKVSNHVYNDYMRALNLNQEINEIMERKTDAAEDDVNKDFPQKHNFYNKTIKN